ncbi:hypothetical protein [Ralstonia mannitolilytica]|uniref:hypothetical protein n=1 Tax=Ralstonia mannitolilytica TaxID=105219 RepID=UPI003B83BC3C
MAYEMEQLFEIWDNADGTRIEVGLDRDGLGLLEIRQRDEKGNIEARMTFPFELARLARSTPLYTHPEASAPGLSEERASEAYKLLAGLITGKGLPSQLDGVSLAIHDWLCEPVSKLTDIIRNTRASAATVAEPSDKLNAPAQVGNTVFRKGVEARLVVEAAQRNYQRTHNPTEEDKRIAAGVESITQLRKQIEAEHDAKSPFQREVEKLGQRECRHCGWLCMPNDAPAKTFYPLEPQAAQQQTNQGASHEWDASGERCLKCGDKDWFAGSTCSGKAAQQQAEPESVIKRQAQKIGELIADRDSWIEAHARLYRLYHDQSPRAGEEIHVNVEGGDVYTLPLQLSGMDKPRFVVHVPCSPQAEPGADERAAFEAWASKRRMDLRREANNPDEYLLASTADACVGWLARAAQSGERAGVAEKDKDSVVVPRWLWDRMNAAPTQQQEGGDV